MKIVLIEANGSDRDSIRSMLEKRREHIVSFDDGDAAWRYIQDTPDVDIIITSLNTNSLSGLEICWNSRILAEQRKAMYVIAISERDDADMLVEALDSGADDYLQKPLHEEILLARLRVAERMVVLQKQLVQLANHDPLTNLFNRRAFFEHAQRCLADPARRDQMSAIMFDIDHFKRVNDLYGHDAGDKVIKAVAQIASSEGALLGRLGGEEFAMIIENQSLLNAARAAERVRMMIETTPIIAGGRSISITSSFGVSSYMADDSVDDLLKRADLALYASKRNGRNRVTIERFKPDRPEMIDAETIHIRQKSRG